MITDLLKKVVEKRDLTAEEARGFLSDVVKGNVTPAQIASMLTALRMKGESAGEITGLVQAMRESMINLVAPGAIDIVGTGGDGSGTFNISTAAAFVAAGARAKVAKHGNRAASSKCGSADVLEALGVHIQLKPEEAQKVYDKVGLIFMLAPIYHGSMKEVGAVRKELKFRTIFNVLGPFANPASTKRQLTGVANIRAAKRMATAAKELGYERILIVSSEDGLDEISLSAKTHLFDVRKGAIKTSIIDPKSYGFKKVPRAMILGGGSETNAAIIRSVLDGAKSSHRAIVVLNAAYGLLAAGIVRTPKEGIKKAEESIDSGRAKAVLESLVRETRKFA